MKSSQKKVIAELQSLNFRSLEFYNVATGYFCRRLRVVRNCGLFFICFAALLLPLVFVSQGDWLSTIGWLVGSCFFAIIGWAPYRIGKNGILMVKTARKADVKYQMDALHFLAATSKPFRGDPVGAFVLQFFGDDDHAV